MDGLMFEIRAVWVARMQMDWAGEGIYIYPPSWK